MRRQILACHDFSAPAPRAFRAALRAQRKDGVVVGTITGAKVFSATRAKEREELGETVTRWIKANPNLEIIDKIVTQSSDREFHCVTITFFYRERVAEAG